jgi:hypothetical protein
MIFCPRWSRCLRSWRSNVNSSRRERCFGRGGKDLTQRPPGNVVSEGGKDLTQRPLGKRVFGRREGPHAGTAGERGFGRREGSHAEAAWERGFWERSKGAHAEAAEERYARVRPPEPLETILKPKPTNQTMRCCVTFRTLILFLLRVSVSLW